MYRNKLPEEVLKISNVDKLIRVLDELQAHKTYIINSALRINNLKTTTNKNWVLKQLEEIGIVECSSDIRLVHLIQLLANWDSISAHVGCEMGIRLLVQALTFGNVSIALSNTFHNYPDVVLLNDPFVGFLVNSTDSLQLGLTDSTEDLFVNETLHLSVDSYLWYGSNATTAERTSTDNLLKELIKRIVPFTTNLTLTISYNGTTDRFNNYLNTYFI